MDAGVAWVLNLDADFELAFGAGYAPNQAVLDAVRRHARSLVGTLTAAGDRIVDETTAPGSANGCAGRAFCPTPRAIATLRRAGAEPEPHPAFDVLRRVNGRAFCHALGATLPHASFETELGAATSKLASMPAVGNGWRVKRSFGVAGRGQRVHRPGESTAFLEKWIEDGGVQIEPNVAIAIELGMHAMLEPNGAVAMGAVVIQTCDAAGAWLSSAIASDHPRTAEMREEVTRVARALNAAGYFGPFGVDAFEWRDENGALVWNARSEINARYSMGFAKGLMTRQ